MSLKKCKNSSIVANEEVLVAKEGRVRATGKASEVVDAVNKKSVDLLIKWDEKIQRAINHCISLAQKLVEERLKSTITIQAITEKMGNEILNNQHKHDADMIEVQHKHDADMIDLKVQVETNSINVNCLQTHLNKCQKRNKELKATIKRGTSKKKL